MLKILEEEPENGRDKFVGTFFKLIDYSLEHEYDQFKGEFVLFKEGHQLAEEAQMSLVAPLDDLIAEPDEINAFLPEAEVAISAHPIRIGELQFGLDILVHILHVLLVLLIGKIPGNELLQNGLFGDDSIE